MGYNGINERFIVSAIMSKRDETMTKKPDDNLKSYADEGRPNERSNSGSDVTDGLRTEIRKQRSKRMLIMTMLVLALMLTVVYGTLENPFSYTLSNIGNFFDYRLLFIIWAIVAGLAIQTSVVTMFHLEGWTNPYAMWFTGLSTFFLIITALIPAVKSQFPVWHLIHTACAGLHAFFLLLAFTPFIRWLTKENPRLRLFSTIWFLVIWVGSFLIAVLLGHSGLFELWFFVILILYLLYLSVIMFEEKIIALTYAYIREADHHELDFETIFSKTSDES